MDSKRITSSTLGLWEYLLETTREIERLLLESSKASER